MVPRKDYRETVSCGRNVTRTDRVALRMKPREQTSQVAAAPADEGHYSWPVMPGRVGELRGLSLGPARAEPPARVAEGAEIRPP